MAASKSAVAIHVDGTHYKFWKYDVVTSGNSHVLKCSWGRLGTSGQEKQFTYSAEYLAIGEGRAKLDEKRRKGYRVVSPAELEVFNQRGALVGAGTKVDRLMFAKRSGPTSYTTISDEIANTVLADPKVEPAIWVVLTRTGGKGTYQILITHEGQFVLSGTKSFSIAYGPTATGYVGVSERIDYNNRTPLKQCADDGFLTKIAPSIEKLAATLIIKDNEDNS